MIMGTADFDMSMTLRGTADEITVMLKEFKRYCGRDTEAYFSMPSAEIGDEHVVLDPDDEEFESMLEKAQGELTVSAAGPYGKYFIITFTSSSVFSPLLAETGTIAAKS